MGSQPVYDAIVVGSGASGGWAAYQLTRDGMRVLVLDAGPLVDPARDFRQHKRPYEMPFRGLLPNRLLFGARQPVQSRSYACDEYSHHFFVDDVDNPYTTEAGAPFQWIRSRQVGGRTIVWARQSYRFSDHDLKAGSRDGFGDDWPISYADLSPYYDRVERFVGISGARDGIRTLPDGQFLPPMKMTCGERVLKRAVERRWSDRRVIIGRSATLTVPHNGRAKCHFCGHCERGCTTWSYFSSPGSTLPAAARTGRLTLRPNAVVSHLVMDPHAGRAVGVGFIDRITRTAEEANAKIVILCASTIESTRILFNSATREYPDGVGNSSGLLGRYLMDHTCSVSVAGLVPTLARFKDDYEDARPNGVYIPNFRNVRDRHPAFLRGYGVQATVQRGMLPTTLKSIPGFGADFKALMRQSDSPPPFWMGAFGEMLPRRENRVTLNKTQTDAWGIPVAHIACRISDNERAMARDQLSTLTEMAHQSGFEVTFQSGTLADPGVCSHEVGTARMGANPRTSVLNSFNQTWDVKNLFVTDGSCFVSQGTQNPTLTMMALTARACDYIVDQFRKGGL
jgi:choline dehydrogenase-like flavoprotein